MTTKSLKNGVGVALALLGMCTATAAQAQLTPGHRDHTPAPADYSPGSPPPTTSRDPGMVILAEYIEACVPTAEVGSAAYLAQLDACEMPRAVREGDFALDTPTVSREHFLARWPNAGEEGYNRIVTANNYLASEAYEIWNMLIAADELLINVDNAYEELTEIHLLLPESARGATRVMTIAEAGATGALCLLSAGLYCVAAVATLVGRFFVNRAHLRQTLANLRIALANILLSRVNITLQRITIRLDSMWIRLAIPAFINRDGGEGWVPGDQSPFAPLTLPDMDREMEVLREGF